MPVGLQIFNAEGNITLDVTDYVGGFVGAINTNGRRSGSFTVSSMIGKRFFYFAYNPNSIDEANYIPEIHPEISFNATTGTITWLYESFSDGDDQCYADIFYGAY